MRTVRRVAEARGALAALRAGGRTVGFVPTMGCLHEGHMSLVAAARARAAVVAASIFVNPAQFGPGEDFASYPRTFPSDAAMCEAHGVDLLFAPSAEELYLPGASTWVAEESLSAGLCGRTRAGHFRGVCTVVAKLFNIIQPDVAVFGRKDAQQAAVVKRMVRDLNFPVEIVVAPTVREPDGLAMSSRNRYLSPDERRRALSIHRGLLAARSAFAGGAAGAEGLCRLAAAEIEAAGGAVEYAEVVDGETLAPVTGEAYPGCLIAVAARFGSARLIDNMDVA